MAPTRIAGRVLTLAALQASLVVMLRTAEGGALSLFLGHLGADQLPYTFLSISLIDVPLTLIYVQVARRLPTRGLLIGLAVVLVAALFGARAVAEVHRGAGLFIAYVAATSLNTFIVIQWGAVLLEFFTVDESLRAFPLIYTGSHAGGLLAGLALRHLPGWVGTEDLLLLVPAAACGGALILAVLVERLTEGRAWRQGGEVTPARAQGLTGLRHFGLLRRSPLLRAIAAATAVMVCLRLALRFSYGAGFEAAFDDTDELTQFIGTYTIVASLGSIALQVLVVPALLRRLGAGLLNVVYAYLVGAALLFAGVFGGLPAAVFGRLTDLELKGALKTPVSPMFYEAMGKGRRKISRALILGIISPVTSLLSSVVLVAVTELSVSLVWIVSVGAALAVAYVVLAHLQARAYHRALEEQVVGWHRHSGGGAEGDGLEAALEAARGSDEQRVVDLEREVSRRRRY